MKNSLLLLAFLTVTVAAGAQPSQDSLTTADYDRAARFLYANTITYIDHWQINPHWIDNDRFWFRDVTAKGSKFILVDAREGTRTMAFDHQKLAAALSKAVGKNYSAAMLPFQSFRYINNEQAIVFEENGKRWECELETYQCTLRDEKTSDSGNDRYQRNQAVSPNGELAAFIRDYNLWVRNLETGEEVQLTTKGIKNFGYATDNASWRHSDRPILRWSPDSKKIATYRQDQRNVSNMYLVSTEVGEPYLEKWKYVYPGDSTIMKIHRVIIDVENRKVIPLEISPDPRRSTQLDDITNDGHLADVQWSPDGSKLAFVSTSRYHKIEKVRIADAATGEVREIFQEKVPTQFSSGYGGVNWRYLPESQEFIWYSQRDNWGHLYLYDAKSGELKHKITEGEYTVSNIYKVDRQNRVIYFSAYGLDEENPYFAKLAKINFDGSGFKVLTPESGDHRISFSPSEKYFIDSYSKPDTPPITVLRNLKGEIILTVAQTDISRLLAQGWKPPVPFKVKASDGETDIYGLMYTPTHLDRDKKYPIIDYIYPGPQGGSIGSWSFSPASGDNQALAELGFVVVEIVGTCNPRRTKDFQDRCYGQMATNTLPDQIAAIRQLAGRYSFIDTTRVGIWGHSGGGFATATAMFRYPDFFDVGISESGNHDNRNYESDWGDRFNGPISDSAYAAQANQNYAENLEGKLMLTVGMMDSNVPPQNTMLVVQALIEANKDFDLIVYPNARHGYGKHYYYQMRRRWDYFVKHLLGKEPPEEYKISFN
ncbi:MAG TPA: DPP IV N-terminal domain-containing protein [Balneolaceae bacterium]